MRKLFTADDMAINTNEKDLLNDLAIIGHREQAL